MRTRLAAVLAAVLVLGSAGAAAAQSDEPTSRLAIVNGFPNGDPIDVAGFVEGLPGGEYASVGIGAGDGPVQVTDSATGEVVAEVPLSVSDGESVSLTYHRGIDGAPTASVARYTAMPAPGESALTALHYAAAGPLTVTGLPAPNQRTTELTNGESDSLTVPEGTYDWGLTAPGSNEILAELPMVEAPGGGETALMAIGSNEQGDLALIAVPVGGDPAGPPNPDPGATPTPAPSPSEPAPGARQTSRLAGPDRITTAVAISQAQFPQGASTVYLARADAFADALAGGTLTAGPILLVPSCGELPAPVAQEITRLGAATVTALGGEDAVCQAIVDAAAAA